MRNIYERPAIRKPSIGNAPSYLYETEENMSELSYIFSNFKDSILKGKPIAKGLLIDYIDCFLNLYKEYQLDFDDEDIPYDQQIYDSIVKFLPQKNEFVDLLQFLGAYTQDFEYYKQIFSLFEKILKYNYRKSNGYIKNYQFDNFRFYSYELFLNLIASLIEFERFEFINHFLSEQYFYRDFNENKMANYIIFQNHLSSLDDKRNKRLELKRKSIVSDLIKERASKKIKFCKLMEADALLFLKNILFSDKYSVKWFPYTLVYYSSNPQMELFIRSKSKKYFKNLLLALDIENKDELISRWEKSKDYHRYDSYQKTFGFRFPGFENIFNIDELGSK